MQLGEIVVLIGSYNFTKFHQNQMKNKKGLLIARFSVQNFKVSVESSKSYIVTQVNSAYLSHQPKNLHIALPFLIAKYIYQQHQNPSI